jgi:hypothetical protein
VNVYRACSTIAASPMPAPKRTPAANSLPEIRFDFARLARARLGVMGP